MSRRLPDIVELFSRKFREITTIIKHPFAVGRRELWKRGRSIYENAEVPGGAENRQSSEKVETTTGTAAEGYVNSHSTASYSSQDLQRISRQETYPNELVSDHRQELEKETETETADWTTPLDPILPVGAALKGSQWYEYTIGQLMRHDPWVRWYHATNQAEETVIIQEYLLPNTEFHPRDIQARQQAFVQLVNFNIDPLNGPGEGRDFRILKLIEAFSTPTRDETALCYLVAKPLPGIPLRHYLEHHGNLRSSDIREALRQVLQSLQFLHTGCRIKFSSTYMERGIPHGNLSLDSLFIRQTDLVGVNSDRQFFVHLSDLLLWEHLIYPPASPKFHGAIAQSADDIADKLDDLRDLGRIGFQLAGCTLDPDKNDIVELRDGQAQAMLNDEPLYHFLCRLIGQETPIKTADHALETLRNLPQASLVPPQVLPQPADETRSRHLTPWGLPLAVLVLCLLGTAAWLGMRKPASVVEIPLPAPDSKANDDLYLTAAPVPKRPLQYQIESGGVWQDVMWSKLLHSDSSAQSDLWVAEKSHDLIPLIAEIKRRQPQLKWSSSTQSRFQTAENVLKFVRQSPQNVGLIRVSEISDSDLNKNRYAGLEKQTIAYDGLAILVPFRDFYNASSNVPGQLEGSISLSEIKQLYTSDDLDDVKLRGDISVELHFPNEADLTNQDTIRLFKEKVLGGDQDLIDKFNQLRRQAIVRDRTLVRKHNLKNNLYEKMLYTYEKVEDPANKISIGFDRLSRSLGQCSVYPLAIRNSLQSNVQPLVQVDNQPIQTDADLCDIRSSYYVSLPERYPLRYELALIYQQGSETGKAFGEMLSTQEAQYLLGEVGLVPATVSREELWSFMWGETNLNE